MRRDFLICHIPYESNRCVFKLVILSRKYLFLRNLKDSHISSNGTSIDTIRNEFRRFKKSLYIINILTSKLAHMPNPVLVSDQWLIVPSRQTFVIHREAHEIDPTGLGRFR